VKPDTELPKMPSPILEAPDETVYHKAQAELDEKIDAIKTRSVSTPHLSNQSPYRKTSARSSKRSLPNSRPPTETRSKQTTATT
jgi:hypothetical protein